MAPSYLSASTWRSCLFSEVMISLESFLASKNQKPPKMILYPAYNGFPVRETCSDLWDAQFSGAAKRCFLGPYCAIGVHTKKHHHLVAGKEGMHKIILVEEPYQGNDAAMTRPMQEHTASKTLIPLDQGHSRPQSLLFLCVLPLPDSLLHKITCKKLNALTHNTLALNS